MKRNQTFLFGGGMFLGIFLIVIGAIVQYLGIQGTIPAPYNLVVPNIIYGISGSILSITILASLNAKQTFLYIVIGLILLGISIFITTLNIDTSTTNRIIVLMSTEIFRASGIFVASIGLFNLTY